MCFHFLQFREASFYIPPQEQAAREAMARDERAQPLSLTGAEVLWWQDVSCSCRAGQGACGPQTAAAASHPFQVTDTLSFLDGGSLGHRCVTHAYSSLAPLPTGEGIGGVGRAEIMLRWWSETALSIFPGSHCFPKMHCACPELEIRSVVLHIIF